MLRYGFIYCVVLSFLYCVPAAQAARFEVAAANFNEKKYDVALLQFTELAGLGNKDAQYYLGLMHLNGWGVAMNLEKAYAWISLSASTKNKDYLKVKESFEVQLVKSKRLGMAKAQLVELQAVYADKKIHDKLKPNNKNGYYEGHWPINRVSPRYPSHAYKSSISGSVDLTYLVDANGRAKYLQVMKYPQIYSDTSRLFVSSALDAARSLVYKPIMIGSSKVEFFGVTNRYTFEMSGMNGNHNKLVSQLASLKQKAYNGSSIDRYQYARASGALYRYLNKENKKKFSDQNSWYYKAAVDGLPAAKYQLGRNILYGEQCEADNSKSHFWLVSAAKDGFKDAQLLYGMERHKGVRFDKNESVGIDWMKKSADAGYDPAKIELALAYVFSQNKELRNIDKAINYIESVDKKFVDKISVFEAKAAVYSAAGDNKKAIKAQKSLLKLVKKYKLPQTIYQDNYEHLKQGKKIESLI